MQTELAVQVIRSSAKQHAIRLLPFLLHHLAIIVSASTDTTEITAKMPVQPELTVKIVSILTTVITTPMCVKMEVLAILKKILIHALARLVGKVLTANIFLDVKY